MRRLIDGKTFELRISRPCYFNILLTASRKKSIKNVLGDNRSIAQVIVSRWKTCNLQVDLLLRNPFQQEKFVRLVIF